MRKRKNYKRLNFRKLSLKYLDNKIPGIYETCPEFFQYAKPFYNTKNRLYIPALLLQTNMQNSGKKRVHYMSRSIPYRDNYGSRIYPPSSRESFEINQTGMSTAIFYLIPVHKMKLTKEGKEFFNGEDSYGIETTGCSGPWGEDIYITGRFKFEEYKGISKLFGDSLISRINEGKIIKVDGTLSAKINPILFTQEDYKEVIRDLKNDPGFFTSWDFEYDNKFGELRNRWAKEISGKGLFKINKAHLHDTNIDEYLKKLNLYCRNKNGKGKNKIR